MKKIEYNSRFLWAVVAVTMVGMNSLASADEGVARISDGEADAPELLPIEATTVGYSDDSNCPNCQRGNTSWQSNGGYSSEGVVYGEGAIYGGECYGGDCNGGSCDNGGGHGCYPADAGWGRPIRNYIRHTPVVYLKRWPDAVYGINHNVPMRRFPMVYQPTDTTQLGFTYQRVPTWQPKPWMLPPMPWPNQWHLREAGYARAGYGGYHGGYGVGGGVPCEGELISSEIVSSEIVHEGPGTPTQVTSPPEGDVTTPVKDKPTEIPPAPPEVRFSAPDPLQPVAY